MITVQNMSILKSLPNKPEEGEFAVLEDTRKVYIFKDGEWEEFDGKGNLNISIYELNQSAMSSLPKHDFKQRLNDTKIIKDFIKDTRCGDYYMLLCRDINYYTLFSVKGFDFVGEPLSKELITCIDNVGEIIAFDLNETKDAIEIWIKEKQTKKAYCMLFFNYTNGVIEVSAK